MTRILIYCIYIQNGINYKIYKVEIVAEQRPRMSEVKPRPHKNKEP